MDWLAILVNLVITGILLYVFQKAIDERSEKRMEKFKAELRENTYVQETKFSKLHEKRFVAISEIYQLILKMQSVLSFALVIVYDIDNKKERDKRLKDVLSAETELREYFNENKLFLPDPLCNNIEEFLSWTMRANFELLLANPNENTSGRKNFPDNEHNHKKFLKAMETINNRIEPLTRDIEKKTRELIGS